MNVRTLKDGTRCSGKIYNIGDEITCTEEQAAKLIALGRAARINTRGTRKAADSDAPVRNDAVEPDDNGDDST